MHSSKSMSCIVLMLATQNIYPAASEPIRGTLATPGTINPQDLHRPIYPIHNQSSSMHPHTAHPHTAAQEFALIREQLTQLQQSNNQIHTSMQHYAQQGYTKIEERLARMENRLNELHTAHADTPKTLDKMSETIDKIKKAARRNQRQPKRTLSIAEIRDHAERSMHHLQTELNALRNVCNQPLTFEPTSTSSSQNITSLQAPRAHRSSSDSEESESVDVDEGESEEASETDDYEESEQDAQCENTPVLSWKKLQETCRYLSKEEVLTKLTQHIASLEQNSSEINFENLNRSYLEKAKTLLKLPNQKKAARECFNKVDEKHLQTAALGIYRKVEAALANQDSDPNSKRQRSR